MTLGTGASREDVREILELSKRIPDKAIAEKLRSQNGFTLRARSVCDVRGSIRDEVKSHNARIPVRIAAVPHHRNDEAKMKGGGGGNGGGNGGGRVLP